MSVKISELTNTPNPITGVELVEVVQAGLSHKTTVDDILSPLANDSDPAKGAALVGYNGSTVADELDGWRDVDSFYEAADGADWLPAIQRCTDAQRLVRFREHNYPISGSIVPKFSGQTFVGIRGPLGSRIVAQGDFPIFDIQLAFREAQNYHNISLAAQTPGQATGIYSPSNRYFPTADVKGVSFEASLKKCVDANIILIHFEDCDFGTFGSTAGATHQHIISTGETLNNSAALATNLNKFDNCRFRNARGTQYGSEISNGFMYNLSTCDVEMNYSTVAVFRFRGVLGVYLDQACWFERNYGTHLIQFDLDPTGALQGSLMCVVDGCWLSLDAANTHAINSPSTNFSMIMTNCTGTGFSGKGVVKVGAATDPQGYMQAFFNNRLTGYGNAYRQNMLYNPFLVLPEAAAYVAKAANGAFVFQNAGAAEQGRIIGAGDNTTGSVLIETAAGNVTVRNKAAQTTAQLVRTANGTEIRCFSADGTQYRLTPPNAGGAATWIAV